MEVVRVVSLSKAFCEELRNALSLGLPNPGFPCIGQQEPPTFLVGQNAPLGWIWK